jgi:acyl dehydratase
MGLVESRKLERSLLWLDDLAAGQVFESGSRTITRDEIVSFATMFDPQPFHLDEDAAKASLFKGLAASGIHTFGTSVRLLLESTFCLANGLISSGGEIEWRKPVRPGDVLRVRIEISDVATDPDNDRGIVTLKVETLNQNGEVVQIFAPRIVAFKKPRAGVPAPQGIG